MEFNKLSKLALTGTLISTLAFSTAVYVSKNTDIQARINRLYDIATGYKNKLADKQSELDGKQALLNNIASYLGFNEDNPWDGTLDSLKTAIDSKASGQSSADTQALLNKIAVEGLGLPERDKDGNTINYTQKQILTEVMTLQGEVESLERFIEEYGTEVDVKGEEGSSAYAGMTLTQKLESMINQLTTASEEDEAQLALANNKIIALGYCPKHDVELVDGKCTVAKCPWGNGTTENVPDNGNGNNMSLPNSGGSSTGGTPATPAEPEGGTGGQGGTGGTQPPAGGNGGQGETPVTPDSTKLANFEKALRDNAKGISDDAVNALVNNHDNYRLHKDGYVVYKKADGTWVYSSGYSGKLPTRGTTPWNNIKNAYIAVFGEADLMQ